MLSSLAGWTLSVHLLSAHLSPGMEVWTSGVGMVAPSGVLEGRAAFGAYRNSYGRLSLYAGQSWSAGRYSLMLGAATGYQNRKDYRSCSPAMALQYDTCWVVRGATNARLLPVFAPSVVFPEASVAGFTPRVALIGVKRAALHVMAERSL